MADIVAQREPTLNALWVNDLESRPDALLERARASERRWAAGKPRGRPRRHPRHGQGEPRPGRGADALGQRRGDTRATRAELTRRRACRGGRRPSSSARRSCPTGACSAPVSRACTASRVRPWDAAADDRRLVSGRRRRRGRRLRPAARRHRHRGLDPAAGHLARAHHAQAERRSGAARHSLPRPGRRTDDSHARPTRPCCCRSSAAPTPATGPPCRPSASTSTSTWTSTTPAHPPCQPPASACSLDAGCGTPLDPEVRAVVEAAAGVFASAGADDRASSSRS